MNILAIEDEPAILRMLERGLSARGHQILTAESGEVGALMAEDEAIDLVLLDISLPELDGHAVLARIRARRPSLPVLMLTARDDLDNKVRALDAGADDYLTKPFAFEELLARIRALTRRADQQQASQLEAGDLRLELLSRRAWRGERSIDLSSREFALLEFLLHHAGDVVQRATIRRHVWGGQMDEQHSNIIDAYVKNLRDKIDRRFEVSVIETIRGVGYRLRDPDTE